MLRAPGLQNILVDIAARDDLRVRRRFPSRHMCVLAMPPTPMTPTFNNAMLSTLS